MKVRSFGMALGAFIASAGLSSAAVAVDQTLYPAGTTAYTARPDMRGCFVFPACGGQFLYNIDRPFKDLCTADLPFFEYVTGIFEMEKDGTLTEISVGCDMPLTGSVEPDPRYPGYDLFVYLPYVG